MFYVGYTIRSTRLRMLFRDENNSFEFVSNTLRLRLPRAQTHSTTNATVSRVRVYRNTRARATDIDFVETSRRRRGRLRIYCFKFARFRSRRSDRT